MLLLDASQIRKWDQYTIQHEPVRSIDLMERAATACANWILKHFPGHSFDIFCGTGNNGGDGLVIARLLAQQNLIIRAFVINTGTKKSGDFLTNLDRLREISPVSTVELTPDTPLPASSQSTIIIDALLGTGLNRPVEGFTATVVRHINNASNKVIAIDMPAGLQSDAYSGTVNIITSSWLCCYPAMRNTSDGFMYWTSV
jgi:NAD(P)H-hydrate epimerase